MLNMRIITVIFSVLLFFSVSFAQKKPAESQKSHRIEKTINSQMQVKDLKLRDSMIPGGLQ
jgi:YbbR domain-containing protein